MQDLEGGESKPVTIDRLSGDNRSREEIRDKRVIHIFMTAKNVSIDALQEFARARIAENLDRRFHQRVVTPNIVKSKGVVHVIVSEEDPVTPS